MTMKEKLTVVLVLTTLALILAAGSAAAVGSEPTGAEAAAVRVGTFDSRAVALAYGRSPRPDCMLAEVAELRKQHAQAKEEGNEELVKELEIKGPALQEKIHKQVFSGAPVDEILALIKDDLPAVAEAAGVDLIVEGILHSGSGVEVVDISLEMCAPFQLDEESMKMIPQILAAPPIPEGELKHDH
jgi:hypothetical protein